MRITSKRMIGFAMIAIVFFVTSCSSPLKVSTDYDKSVNFRNYKTFSVYNLKTTGSVSQLNADRISNAIRNEMIKKGFTEAGDNAELMVNAVVVLKDKQSTTATTNYYGYGGLYRPYGYYGGMGGMGMGSTSVNTYEYKAGSFIIDVVDNKTQKMIWEGTGSKDFDSAPKDPETAINTGVAKIMEGFPPGVSK